MICAENLSTIAIREARSRLAGRPLGPYQKLRVLKLWVCQAENPSPRFRTRTPLSPGNLLIISPVWFLANYRWAAHKQCINIALLCPLSARVGLVNELASPASSKEIL